MRIDNSSDLPHGYGIGSVKKCAEVNMNLYKEREKQNEEKKKVYTKSLFYSLLRNNK